MRRVWGCLVIAAALAVGPAGVHAQQGGGSGGSGGSGGAVFSFTTVMLHERAEMDGDDASAAGGGARDVLVGRVASVNGADAERVRAVRVTVPATRAESGGGWTAVVTPGDVERALERAGIGLGRVSISGPSCAVVWGGAAPAAPARLDTRAVETATVLTAAEMMTRSPGTFRAVVAVRLAELVGADAADVRLEFDQRGGEWLDRPVGQASAGGMRRVDVQPGALSGSGRVPVQVFVYDGDRLVVTERISATVTVRRVVVTAVGTIERGEVVGAERVRVEERWQSAGVKPAAEIERVVGAIAGVRIGAGQVIGRTDVESPVQVRRGQIVEVHTISGGVTVKAKARAMQSGRDGDVVPFKLEGSNQPFMARISGVGTAVLVVGE